MSAPAAAKCPLRPLSLPSFSFSPCPHLHLSWLPGEILGSRVKLETEWGLGPPLPAAQGTPPFRVAVCQQAWGPGCWVGLAVGGGYGDTKPEGGGQGVNLHAAPLKLHFTDQETEAH